ncbi:MAG: MotA/TolQ/ExbB proton channel family protein [Deltaproteobacteria bacterium]|jgi:hypothetical protein
MPPVRELVPHLLTTCGAELIPLLLIGALLLWGRWVARKHGTRAWWVAAWLPVLGLVVQHVGIVLTILGLIDAFEAVSAAPPESRAAQLAEGIAAAMWATALGVGFASMIYLGCAIAYAVGTFRAPRAKRAEPAPPSS